MLSGKRLPGKRVRLLIYTEFISNSSPKRVLIRIFEIFSIFLSGSEISNFPSKLRFSYESDSKNSFSRSRCVGSEPGIHENLARLEMSTIRNELSVSFRAFDLKEMTTHDIM